MPQKVLYLDPWSGISGDMLLAAILDAGDEGVEGVLHEAVASLGLRGTTVDVVADKEWGVACTRVRVREEQSPPLRHLAEMARVIDRGAVSDRVKGQAQAALTRLAEVEAAIHGCSAEEIHFHEVGAADTLIDVVGTFVLVEALAIDRVLVGTIPVGGGTVEIAHGRMGVPAPATAALLAGYEVAGGPEMRELTTPTGALLVGGLQAQQGPLPRMVVRSVGYGAGTMKLERGPNILRVLIGERDELAAAADGAAIEAIVELQTTIDDVSPEVIGHTLRRVREAGALDAWTVAAQMKKDRPGTVLHVLVRPSQEADAVALLFSETGTLGIRRLNHSRHVAERGVVAVTVFEHPLRVKWGRWEGRLVSLAPEYEDAAAVASAETIPLRVVMQRAVEAARSVLDDDGLVP
jgi:pyridinium-3,5-bisthiocarboxylic acid mononucleotide nickel chelatase